MDKDRQPRWFLGLVVASVILGILLRFVWSGDMEYKYDEQYMFARSQAIGVTEPWPTVGMASGVGLVNPALSTWVFVGLARVAGITTPVGLAQGVAFTGCLALLALAFLIFKVIRPAERESWLWALALVAVNPFAVQIQRKIWAQSILPIFCVAFLWSWMRREKPIGAFFWGLVGALIGQIHMSGFFFTAAFLLWSAWNCLSKGKPVRWKYWLAGSVVGSISLIPWIQYIVNHPTVSTSQPWSELLNFRFWDQWATQIVGISAQYSLGRETFKKFLTWPTISDHSTYLMATAYVVAVVSGASIVLLGCYSLWRERKNWGPAFQGCENETQLAQNAAFWGFGSFLSLARVYVHRHYLVVTYPLQFVWISRLALKNIFCGRTLLLVLWATQLVISAGFLAYIHQAGGAPNGDYGVAYSAQAR